MRYILLILIFLKLYSHNYPYYNTNFKDILNNSKLQAPTSSYDPKYSVHYGKFKNYYNKYFYLSNYKYMTFEMCGKKRRSELRLKDEWRVSDKNIHTLIAQVKVIPKNVESELTILQIHTNAKRSNNLNKPLLRIVWRRYYNNKSDHLWAVIRDSADKNEQKYSKIDLIEREDRFINFKIVVSNSNLQIFVDGIKKIDKNVNYWKDSYNYYKAGIYLQSNGCGKVLFKKLNYSTKDFASCKDK